MQYITYKMDNNIKDFKWTTDHVKTFEQIYTGNFFKLPTFFHWENYQGKNMDGKINQYISDVKDLKRLNKDVLKINHFLKTYKWKQ